MSFTEAALPVSVIPFPTVTICPETKTYSEKLNLNTAFDPEWGLNLSEIE